MMLDYNTAQSMVYMLLGMNGLIALVAWYSQRQLVGMGWIAAAYLVSVPGLILLSIRMPLYVTLGNTLCNVTALLSTEGIATFLQQPRLPRWVLPATVVFSLVYWGAATTWDFDNIQPRIVVSMAITLAFMSRKIWLVWRCQNQSTLLRRLTLTCLIVHTMDSIIRLGQSMVAIVAGYRTANGSVESFLHLWVLLETAVYANLLFFCLLAMFGSRLVEDLRLRDRELLVEHEKQIRLSSALGTERRLRAEQRKFLHVLGHEFNTPLAVIDRSAEMIEMQVGQTVADPATVGAVQGRLDTIRDTVGRLSNLVNDLLRAERANLDNAHPEKLDAVTVARLAVDAVAGRGDPARVRLNLPIPMTRLPFLGDQDMMIMVLSNLITNGLKYSDRTQRVHVTVTRSTDGDAPGAPPSIMFIVRDHGIGFPPGELDKMGHRFFRASNARDVQGTGLGLYIVKQVLEKHGGTLTLENHPEGGAVATVRLPALAPSATEASEPHTGAQAGAERASHRQDAAPVPAGATLAPGTSL